MSEKEAVIVLKDIEKSYGSHRVLEKVNITINKGDIYGLVGKNGAGKTTIFKIILGLSDSNSGTVEICGEDAKKSVARKNIGFYVGQNFFGYMSARQNLMYYARIKNIKNPKAEVERVLKIVELDKAKGRFKGFSMGMRQRLGIANAIMGNPEIIMLDEPINGLDPQGIIDIRNVIKKINEETGATIIISSHILGELQSTAHKFGIINDGMVVKSFEEADLVEDKNRIMFVVNDPDSARKALEDAGVEILVEKPVQTSLEDYYFELIGGKENV